MDSPPLISQPTTCDDLSQEEAQRTSIRSLQKFNAFLLKQNEQLEKRCNDLQRQNDQFSEAILQHASAYWKEWQLIRGGHRISAPSVPEGLAEREWRVLKDSVRNFVTQLLSQTLTLDDAKRLIRESNIQMTQLEKMAESMVEDSRLCPIWLRSWVWHVLYYSIFNTQWWGGTHGETFGLLLKTLSEGVNFQEDSNTAWEHLNNWRIHSTQFIAKMGFYESLQSLDNLAAKMVKDLEPLLSLRFTSPTFGQLEREEACCHMTQIIHKAGEIDRNFRLSKDLFQVYMSLSPRSIDTLLPCPYNPTWVMDCNDLDLWFPGTGVVYLFVSPGLCVYGETDRYYDANVVARLEAFCNLPMVLERLRNPQEWVVKEDPSSEESSD